MICQECERIKSEELGDYPFPQYGLAPHGHDIARTGSIMGSTVLRPKDDWPPNFHEDPEAPGCGVYYCIDPECQNSYEKNKIGL